MIYYGVQLFRSEANIWLPFLSSSELAVGIFTHRVILFSNIELLFMEMLYLIHLTELVKASPSRDMVPFIFQTLSLHLAPNVESMSSMIALICISIHNLQMLF